VDGGSHTSAAAAAALPSREDGAAAGGLPSLLQLTSILAAPSDGGAAAAATAAAASGGGGGVEVTGPSAPLSLVLSHRVDAAQRGITLRCAVHNRTMEAIRGVEVSARLGGWLCL
jgi:hypothetical protein